MGSVIVLVVVGGLFVMAMRKTIKSKRQGGCAGCSGCNVRGECGEFKEK